MSLNPFDEAYARVARETLAGTRKTNRTGVDTLSAFGLHATYDLERGFPLLTTKAVRWDHIVVENLWFLSGARDVGFLHAYDVHFWDHWADSAGKVPTAYGAEWRAFGPEGVDQVRAVLEALSKTPNSRRMVVTAWDPAKALTSALPPCHAFWVVGVHDGRLNLHLTQRSADVALGVPYNVAGYAFLAYLLAHLSGFAPGVLDHSMVDAHVYTAKPDGSMSEYDHVPGLTTQLARESRPPPRLAIDAGLRTFDDVEALIRARPAVSELLRLFRLDGYDPHPAIKFKVAV